MEPISTQLMDPNCKPIHARVYTISRSVEQQLPKTIPLNGLLHHFQFLRKTEQ
jgi:hypothetical protein